MLDELRENGGLSEKTLETAQMLVDWFVRSGGFGKKYCTQPEKSNEIINAAN